MRDICLQSNSFMIKTVGDTFQRAMDHDFKYLTGKIMADYQGVLIVHSKRRQLHLKHLREVFVRCRLFGICLNLKKFLFVVFRRIIIGAYSE